MKLKRWAVLVVLLYGGMLLLLTAPVITLCSLKFGEEAANSGPLDVPFSQAIEVYQEWRFWIWLAVLLAAQSLLLLVPLDLKEKRLKPRVAVEVPIVTSSFLLANLCFAGLLSLLVGVFGEEGWEAYAGLGDLIFQNPLSIRILSAAGSTGIPKDWQFFLTFLQLLGVFWVIWGVVFYRYAKNDKPEALSNRITKWLLRGSILELLIAVPSHVLVRSKHNCCAPMGSFWGIATGISVMLLAFGPGLFFLFSARMSRLKPKATPITKPQETQAPG